MLARLLQTILIFILLTLILLFSLAIFFENRAEDYLINRLKSYFATDFEINDDISFSLIRNFPHASLTLNKVAIKENLPRSKRNLMEAERMAFLFGWGDVFSGNYRIKKLVISDASLNIRSLHDKVNNYEVMKEADAKNPSGDNDFLISLEQTEIYNMRVNYIDEPADREITFTIDDGYLSGNFASSRYTLDLYSNIKVHQFYVGNSNYLPEKKARLALKFDMNFDTNKYTISDGKLTLQGNKFELGGFVQYTDKHTDTDLKITGKDLDLAGFMQLLPNDYAENLQSLKTNGTFLFNSTIKGKYTQNRQPNIKVNFELKDGTIRHDVLYYPLKNLQLKGGFNNGRLRNKGSSTLNLDNISFEWGGEPMHAKMIFSDLDNMQADLQIDGKLELKALRNMLESSGIDKPNGSVHLNQIRAKGSIAELTNIGANRYPMVQGNIVVDGVSFKYNDQWVEKINGTLTVNGSDLLTDDFKIDFLKSDLAISGKARGFTPVVFQAAFGDSLNLTKPVFLDIEMKSDLLDGDELLQFMASPEAEKEEKNDKKKDKYRLEGQRLAVGKIGVNVKKLKRRKVQISDIGGELSFNDREFFIEQLLMKLAGGTVDMRGDFTITKDHKLLVKSFLQAEKVDMKRLLAEFENFGQASFTDDNIKGRLTAQTYLYAPFKPDLSMDEPKLHLVTDMRINDGELLDYEPMMALSRFVKVSELERVRFADMQNQIEIKNRVMDIPAMYIKSNVVRLTFSGTHNFDDKLTYYMQLKLSDVLFGKFRRKNRDPDQIKDKTGGIGVIVTGTSEKPNVKYMKKRAVRDRFERDANKQRINLKAILDREFKKGRGNIPDFEPIGSAADSVNANIMQMYTLP